VTAAIAADGLYNAAVSVSNGAATVKLTSGSTYVEAEAWTSASGTTEGYLPRTNASITLTLTSDGVAYKVTIPFTSSYTKRWAEFKQSDYESLQAIGRVMTNRNLIDEIPQPTMTDTEFSAMFTNIGKYSTRNKDSDGNYYATPLFQCSTLSSDSLRCPFIKFYCKNQYVYFAVSYADWVTKTGQYAIESTATQAEQYEYVPKAGCKLTLQVLCKVSGNTTIYAAINGYSSTACATVANDDMASWQLVTIDVDTDSAKVDGTDKLYIRFKATQGDSSVYIADMSLLYSAGSTVETDGYVRITADQVSLGVRTGLAKTGIDITDGTITATADNFRVKNSSGEETMAIDRDGNLVAGSFAAESDNTRATFDASGLHFTHKSNSGGVHIGVDGSGYPFLYCTDLNGGILWTLGLDGYSAKGDSLIITEGDATATETVSGTSHTFTYTATFTIQNNGDTAMTIAAENLKMVFPHPYTSGNVEVSYASAISLTVEATKEITLTKTLTVTTSLFAPLAVTCQIKNGRAVIGTITSGVVTS